jgi:uncharacterized protein YjbI with pentapeptide repeats
MTTTDDLQELARLHEHWLAGDPSGRQLNLSGAVLRGAKLQRVRLARAKLSQVDFSGAQLAGISFHGSDIDAVHWDGASLEVTTFSECEVRGSWFDGANLTDCTLTDSRVSGCSFSHARLDRGNLAKSAFHQTSLKNAVVVGGNLARWEARESDLSGCDLRGANLRWATLASVDLRGVDLGDAHLYGTLFTRTKVASAHGTPFIAEHFGSQLDFSPEGDGSDIGSVERLREQLQGGRGVGSARYGLGATPELYRAYEVNAGVERYFAISRVADSEDVFRIRKLAVEDVCLVVEYEQLDPRFEAWLAADLIFDVFLMGFLQDVYRGTVLGVDYRSLSTGRAHIADYGAHQPPARPRPGSSSLRDR